jgi:hypothetical protein
MRFPPASDGSAHPCNTRSAGHRAERREEFEEEAAAEEVVVCDMWYPRLALEDNENNRLNRKSVEQKFFVCAEHRDDAMIAISA